jgi:hypothetical protein
MGTVGDSSDEKSGESQLPSSWHLEVAREDLVRALRVLAKARRGLDAAEAVLTYSDGQLEIEFPMASASIPARGQWESAVRVPPPFAVKLVRVVPPPDPLHIYIKGDRLHFASLSVELEPGGETGGRNPHLTPPSFKELLQFGRAQSSPEQLKLLRGFSAFAEAEQKANNLFNSAAKLLEPFGVTNADLSRMIWDCLDRDPPKSDGR